MLSRRTIFVLAIGPTFLLGLLTYALDRSDSPEAVREAKSLLSKIRREQARFCLEVQKDDDRWGGNAYCRIGQSELPWCIVMRHIFHAELPSRRRRCGVVDCWMR